MRKIFNKRSLEKTITKSGAKKQEHIQNKLVIEFNEFHEWYEKKLYLTEGTE